VPADPVLAPLFGGMPPEQPGLLAGWIAEALGGPTRLQTVTGPREAVGATSADFGEEHRARWAELAARAADDAKLPADPGFRSALSSCIEWLSRTALVTSSGPRAEAETAPVWGWGPAGPSPAAGPVETADEPDEAGASLPGPDQTVGFAAHIKPLFRERDRQSMSFAFDLWSYDDVRTRAPDILSRLRDGSMPCDGAWPAAKIDAFSRWLDTGMRP
jgi:truncated hemoglobin YjbI